MKVFLAVFFGVVLAFLVVFIGCSLLFTSALVESGQSIAEIERDAEEDARERETEREQLLSNLEVTDVRTRREGGYIYFTARITNKNDKPVNFVKIGVEYIDRKGESLTTDWSYAVGEPLHPNQARQVEMVTQVPGSLAEYRWWLYY